MTYECPEERVRRKPADEFRRGWLRLSVEGMKLMDLSKEDLEWLKSLEAMTESEVDEQIELFFQKTLAEYPWKAVGPE